MLPFSQACENNKNPILNQLRHFLRAPVTVWEIGSGTGQHAVYFAEQLPHIQWQPTDLAQALPGIAAWVAASSAPNLHQPLPLDVCDAVWPTLDMAAAFTANTLHIMDDFAVQSLFKGVGQRLLSGGLLFTYGPFLYDGQYTSESNAQFDLWLKARDPNSGIKAIEMLQAWGQPVGLCLQEDLAMPANNQLLVWEKTG